MSVFSSSLGSTPSVGGGDDADGAAAGVAAIVGPGAVGAGAGAGAHRAGAHDCRHACCCAVGVVPPPHRRCGPQRRREDAHFDRRPHRGGPEAGGGLEEAPRRRGLRDGRREQETLPLLHAHPQDPRIRGGRRRQGPQVRPQPVRPRRPRPSACQEGRQLCGQRAPGTAGPALPRQRPAPCLLGRQPGDRGQRDAGSALLDPHVVLHASDGRAQPGWLPCAPQDQEDAQAHYRRDVPTEEARPAPGIDEQTMHVLLRDARLCCGLCVEDPYVTQGLFSLGKDMILVHAFAMLLRRRDCV
mmetsp:Transcript_43049/g.105248  ORF Transcript_43049/g.105248 Transcript_43049/m.105248 type:complete len:299 (-) Transcript_43049:117-1013(-)